MDRIELLDRLHRYARANDAIVGEALGFGVHGSVFSGIHQSEPAQTALKVHERELCYVRERDVYLRLKKHKITEIRGCNVPQLIAFDDELWILEMTIVARPFVLDFAGAYLDQSPEFSEEVLADWQAEKREQFDARWPEVQAILRVLEGYGVFMIDVNPGNIAFAD